MVEVGGAGCRRNNWRIALAASVIVGFLISSVAASLVVPGESRAEGKGRDAAGIGINADLVSLEQSIVDAGIPPTSFALTIIRGWNFVTIPVMNSDYKASNIGLRVGDVVSSWNSTIQNFDKTFIVGKSPPSTDFSIAASTAYLVYAGTNETLNLSGIVPSVQVTKTAAVPGKGGWDAIGFLGLNATRHASDVPKMFTGGKVTAVSIFDPVKGAHISYIVGFPFTDFVIPVGLGVWCYCTASGTFAYLPSSPPVTSFTVTVDHFSVTVDASGSYDPDRTIVSYEWDFGDGATATGATASHTYASLGTWWITLTLTDNDGLTSSLTRQVTISFGPPGPPDSYWYIVYGTVTDSLGDPLGASVTLTCLETGAVWYLTADPEFGFFSVDLGTNWTGWDGGDTIMAEVNVGNLHGTNQGIIMGPGNEAYLWLDVVVYPT